MRFHFSKSFNFFCGIILILSACQTPPNHSQKSSLVRYEFNRPAMGLPFRIVLFAQNKFSAEAAAEAAFSRINQLNNLLSDYDPESELSRLSRTAGKGKAVRVSDDLWRVLKCSQELSGKSDGAFDVTVGPSVNLWRKARRSHEMPDAKSLAEARAAVGYKNLKLDSQKHTAELLVPNMRLDLGAIAKGYAVDEALKVLRMRGIYSALVAGGGDLAVSNPPPHKKGWRIELSSLDVTNAPPSKFVLLTRAALATSGDVFQHLEIAGKRYSHIVDPRTGIGLTDHSLVTVIAPNCLIADSLATAVSVMGPQGLRLIETKSGVAARILQMPNSEIEFFESRLFKKFYEIPDQLRQK